jgi:hypothetical protein
VQRSDRRKALAGLGMVFPALIFMVACGEDVPTDEGASPVAAEREFSRSGRTSAEGASGIAAGQIGAPRHEGNARPVLDSLYFEPEEPRSGDAVRVVVEASDPDGDALQLSYTWRLNGKPMQASTESASLTGARKGDVLEVTVTAGDGRAVSLPDKLSVQIANRAPEVTSVRLVPEDGIPPRGKVALVAEASDPDGDPVELEYTWMVNGTTVAGDGAELLKQVGSGDRVSVRVVASDGEEEGERFELPDVEIENAAPWIVSEPVPPGADGVFRYQVAAEDFDRHRPFRFSLEEAPEGMTLDARSGRAEWTPEGEQSGTHRIVIAVHDSQGASATQGFELVVGDAEASPPASPQGY